MGFILFIIPGTQLVWSDNSSERNNELLVSKDTEYRAIRMIFGPKR